MRSRPAGTGANRIRRLVAAIALAVCGATPVARTDAFGTGDDNPGLHSAAERQGYWLAGADGAVYEFGEAPFHGSPATSHAPGRGPTVAIVATATGNGYWVVGKNGSVLPYGDARYFGGAAHLRLNSPVVGMAPTPSGNGYWLVAADGGVFAFGDAVFHGSTGAIRLNQPVVGVAATPTGGGYWFVAADGGIFAFGDAAFFGSTGALRLNKPVVGMARTPTGNGYWFVATDGGVFAFGDAAFFGSTGDIVLNKPVVGMAPTPTGGGYWFVGADGGVFAFGDAAFHGSAGTRKMAAPVVGLAGIPGERPRVPAGEPTTQQGSSPEPDPGSGPDPQPAPPPPPPPPPPVSTEPFDIAIIGDTGYTDSGDKALLEIREHMREFPLAFVIHAGDIWEEGYPCDDESYAERRDVFDGFSHPFVYTPGDNEWTDCSQSSSDALETVRAMFFPDSQTLGQARMPVERQPEMVENARWSHNGVYFATINEPGASGKGGEHRDRNLEWLHGTFDAAEAAGAAGVLITWQDNPFEPSGGRLINALEDRTAQFGRPVVLVHGDTHRYRIDQPWDDLPNFTRVETHGATSEEVWVRATVNPTTPEVFFFENERT